MSYLEDSNKASIIKSMFCELKSTSPNALKIDDLSLKSVSFSVFIIFNKISSPSEPNLIIVSAILCLLIEGSFLNSLIRWDRAKPEHLGPKEAILYKHADLTFHILALFRVSTK